jgi:hypothetical protein
MARSSSNRPGELIELNRLRGEQEDLLAAGKPRFRCAHCEVWLVRRLSALRRWYFRSDEEDGSFRYQSNGSQSQDDLDERSYNGWKEPIRVPKGV